ncbi:MAG: esterase [Ramlibacter sp.]|nr:esterase [Ramlibacter sp.]
MTPSNSIVVARPAAPAMLVLLFHGVGASAADLVPLARLLAAARPRAMVVSVEAPFPSGFGSGRQWFSVQGVTEANRPERIAQAMPAFIAAVSDWQKEAGADPGATTLVGFSQGAIMSLESTQVEAAPARRVVSIAGRFATPVRRAAPGVRFHLIHGDQDGVVPAAHSSQAAVQLRELGAQVTIDLLPGLGHGIDARAAQLVLDYVGAAQG